MIEQLRKFLSSTGGKICAIIVVLGILGYVGYMVSDFLKGDTPESATSTMFIDAENGKTFRHENKIGDTQPLMSPYSGKATAYPAEACYWTADGGIRKDPYWVLLNTLAHKPEPTFCPDCGRLVVGHNPRAEAGRKPPPTEAEWKASHPAALN